MGPSPARAPKERNIDNPGAQALGPLMKLRRAPMRRPSLGNDLRFPALERDQQLVRAFDFVFGL